MRLRLTGYPAGFPDSWKVMISMAISTEKTVLFGTATHNKAKHLWPVAVFNKTPEAKSYAGFLRLAYKSGDQNMIALLDPAAHKDDEGNALADTKWSVVTVPYAPAPAFEADDAEVGTSI